MESLRVLTLPRTGGRTFITSGRSSPSTSRETLAGPRSLHPSPRASLEQLLDTCGHLQAELRSQRSGLPLGRSRSSMRQLESGQRKRDWRGTERYIAKREAILRSIDRLKLAHEEKEIAVVKQFVSSKRRGSIVHLHAPLRVTCADLQNPRVRTLLSLNKRDFGRPFDLSQVHLNTRKKTTEPVIRAAEEEDGAMLQREIARLQRESLYKASNKAQKPVQPTGSSSPRREVAVEMERLGPLSQFILKEGGKYNSAWFSETRRYRQKRLQEAYLRGWEERGAESRR